MPTANDALLPEEDVLLLKHAYFGLADSLAADILRTFPVVYGETLPFPPLRHAVLALAANDISSTQRRNYHRQQAYSALITKTSRPETILESDVVAAFFLFLGVVDENNQCEMAVHLKGFLSMLAALLQNSQRESLSLFCRHFTTIVFWQINFFQFLFELMPMPRMYALRNSLFGPKSWFSRLHQASIELSTSAHCDVIMEEVVNVELCRNYGILLKLLRGIVLSAERESSVNVILKSVSLDIEDPEFLSTLWIFIEGSEAEAHEYLPLGQL
jgi:hypothetical protein